MLIFYSERRTRDTEGAGKIWDYWQRKLAEDSEKYPLPAREGVYGRNFHFYTQGRMISGAITGLEYSDDGLPMLEVSNTSFAGDKILRLYPSANETWTLVTIHDGVKDRHVGIMTIG